ncbi:TerB family tellurite resistance protein [Parvibaculum sp.]|uniref:tellurite resistance TerB family protein n=1 Tax=Parvibaculum sp. TaxID=2024848 RepID=UPI002722D818|nr:TerB family tellurite resistance protein [Parvibaculum sp.]MDO9127162.1 TerB family tellurite resistance protein [Parvibaculum sp.]MDP1625659.1 TerB family tellurite resistance protein [Parvibaculum sp.]MDP2149022.1 TerB family tellurite resistance protein [Parvibaculum sp.]MDP3328640.1 TerB family tellurite resistance protein [Parvibaculum sp.]
MLGTLKSFLLGAAESKPQGPADLQVAVVALLIRAATSDADFGVEEREAIRRIASASFGLPSSEVAELIAAAEGEEAETLDLHRWTQAIKAAYSEEERVGLIEKMWEVVYADGVLDDYEANLLRRVAGLIYVPDRESGQARQRVMARLGVTSRTD